MESESTRNYDVTDATPLLPRIRPEVGDGQGCSNSGSPTAVLVLSTFVAVSGSFVFGSAVGYSSPAQCGILGDLGLTLAEYSLFGSISTLGAMLGAVVSGKVADLLGRRGAMGFAELFNIVGWVAIAFAKTLFEERVAQLPSLSDDQYLGMFLGGLKPSVRDLISDAETGNVHIAIRAARRITCSSDYPSRFTKSAFQQGTFKHSLPATRSEVHGGVTPSSGSQGSTPPAYSPGSSSPQQQRKTRHLSVEEAHEYRVKGKCFRCSQPFCPLHKCDAKHLNVLIGPPAAELEEQDLDMGQLVFPPVQFAGD
ncbi:hypothetical protein OROMI_014445 [Orobanche minor]